MYKLNKKDREKIYNDLILSLKKMRVYTIELKIDKPELSSFCDVIINENDKAYQIVRDMESEL